MGKKYRSAWTDHPLYVGTKQQMQKFMESRGTRFSETHKIKKVPFIKGGRNRYGIYRR